MAYEANEVEEKWTRFWFDRKFFVVREDLERPAFSIALPPPNVTGNLHLGHALNGTLQDILIRWKRMQGYNVLWQPGTDHASISTHMVVERELRKEGKTRHEIGRVAFEKRVWEWCHKYGSQILNQYRRLGVSFAWDRTVFTMDDHYVKAVNRAFVTLFKEGHIYRGNRVTNWCPSCRTSVSDLEVEHIETEGNLYFTKYSLEDAQGITAPGKAASDGVYIEVATTRPETMFGDVAVAVHPDDKRYQHLIGKSAHIPATGRAVPIIADAYVDMEFGSGALKITSAHDINDWEVCQRHNLPLVAVIDEQGVLLANEYVPERYQGKDRFEVRTQLVEELKEKDLLAQAQPYKHGVAHCERCHTIIEYLPSDQWFVRMKELAGPAITVVEEDRIVFIPERYTSTYLDWMRNIRDWCISRQLWFGQRIPVWTCRKCGAADAFETSPQDAADKCTGCGALDWKQDPDVLDTWFSSSLWPFATLGWPDQTPKMRLFYPTNVLVTAREIINLWVARMIFMSMKLCKTIPFKYVLINPVIQTADGKRMSKSKGNAIDPIEMIEKYGADANRLWYASLGIKGDQDVRFRPDKLEEYKRFVNKLWNAARFVLDNISECKSDRQICNPAAEHSGNELVSARNSLTLPDRWILHQFYELLVSVNSALRNYDFDNLVRQIYEFVWDYFCDWYLETAKVQLAKEETRAQTKAVLQYIFESLVRLLHPLMPFITEELWQLLPRAAEFADIDSIMFAPYPVGNPAHADEAAAADMELLMRTVKAIRNIRQTYNVDAKVQVDVMVACRSSDEMSCLIKNKEYINQLCRVRELTIATEVSVPPLTASEPVFSSTIYLPLSSLIDAQKSRNKLEQRKQSVNKEAARISEVLESGEFKLKAPQDRVQSAETQLAQLKRQLESIDSQLRVLERT